MSANRLIDTLTKVVDGVDFANEANLVDDGFLDSFTLVEIVNALNQEYGIVIDMDDLVPENFASIHTIQAMVDRIAAASGK